MARIDLTECERAAVTVARETLVDGESVDVTNLAAVLHMLGRVEASLESLLAIVGEAVAK